MAIEIKNRIFFPRFFLALPSWELTLATDGKSEKEFHSRVAKFDQCFELDGCWPNANVIKPYWPQWWQAGHRRPVSQNLDQWRFDGTVSVHANKGSWLPAADIDDRPGQKNRHCHVSVLYLPGLLTQSVLHWMSSTFVVNHWFFGEFFWDCKWVCFAGAYVQTPEWRFVLGNFPNFLIRAAGKQFVGLWLQQVPMLQPVLSDSNLCWIAQWHVLEQTYAIKAMEWTECNIDYYKFLQLQSR